MGMFGPVAWAANVELIDSAKRIDGATPRASVGKLDRARDRRTANSRPQTPTQVDDMDW